MDEDKLNINGYVLEKELSNDNSGFSKWGFANKNGRRYFIKEFLAPKYPLDSSSICEKQKNDRLEECREFQISKIKLYSAINSSSDGNIIKIHDFFRQDSKYYITTEVVQGDTLSIKDIFCLPEKKRLLVCLIVAHTVVMLHGKHIVHADLKPDNILVTNEANIKAKLIDFDCSFSESAAPDLGDELNGDLVYLSPEAFMHMAEINSYLTCQMDIFSLGIILHQYLTGEKPQYNNKKYDYIYEAVLDKAKIEVDEALPEEIRAMIQKMLSLDPNMRPSAADVFHVLYERFQYICGENDSASHTTEDSQLQAGAGVYGMSDDAYAGYIPEETQNIGYNSYAVQAAATANAYSGYDTSGIYDNTYSGYDASGMYDNTYAGYDTSGMYDNTYAGYDTTGMYNNTYGGYDIAGMYDYTYSGYDAAGMGNDAYSSYETSVEYNNNNAYNGYGSYDTTENDNNPYSGSAVGGSYDNGVGGYASSEIHNNAYNMSEAAEMDSGEQTDGYIHAGSLKGDLYNREIKKEMPEKEGTDTEEKSFFSSAGNL